MRSWNLGRYFGINLYVHWSFWLLVLFIGIRYLSLGGFGWMVYGCALLVCVFGCVTLHEYGHALMARRFGIRTLDITLYPLGGVARLERMSENPWQELWIALAGPAVNLAIAGILLPLALGWMAYSGESLAEPRSPIGFLRDLIIGNLVLVAFNMLPAFPMDGGRVLRALLVPAFGRVRATQIAAGLGAIFAVIFVIVGIAWEGFSMLLIAAPFVFIAGQQELAYVLFRAFNRQAPVMDALPVDEEIQTAVAVDFDPAFTGLLWDQRVQAWVLWQNGKPIHTYPISS